MKLLYQITKKLKEGPNQNLPLKVADGKIITVEKEKIERWKELFQQVQIFQRIWDEEGTPDTWKTGTIIMLPKKGDLGNYNNWRGIATLLSITCTIFSRIILKRISAATDTVLRQEPAGFRRGKSCIDHIFMLWQILEQST